MPGLVMARLYGTCTVLLYPDRRDQQSGTLDDHDAANPKSTWRDRFRNRTRLSEMMFQPKGGDKHMSVGH